MRAFSINNFNAMIEGIFIYSGLYKMNNNFKIYD